MADPATFIKYFRYGIGRRMMLYILSFSSIITLIITSVQLFIDYDRDVRLIETRLEQIQTIHLNSIIKNLWLTNHDLIQIHLEGIMRIPDMQYLDIHLEDGTHIQAGTPSTTNILQREYPLYYLYREQNIFLGTLYAKANLEGVYQRLYDKCLIILVSQGIKTFLVSLFILGLFYFLVGRHLQDLVEHTRRVNLNKDPSFFQFQDRKKPTQNQDELDHLLFAFNQMWSKLHAAFQKQHRTEETIRKLNLSLENRIRERTAELTIANEEMEAFCYSVSHDLRAPLRAIDGFSQILMEDYEKQLDKEGLVFLQSLRDGSQEMGALIEGLLQLFRSVQGETFTEKINLSFMAQTILDELKMVDSERQVTNDITPELFATGDPRLLKNLLENLIGNAWKYSGTTAEAKIIFGAEKKDGEITYFVKDNGVGFDMAYADKLFQPFQRLHKVGEFEGTGIGLATVQKIVHRHGGRIWAEAEVGKGATFFFTLPTKEDQP